MKIYTRTGDKGETGLIGGRRTSKADQRIIAYGAVDELNSSIGMAKCMLAAGEVFADLVDVLTKVQNDLFVVGSDLADPDYPDKREAPRVTDGMASALEPVIDKFEQELNPITFFILPGGNNQASILHICRSVARRAEVEAVTLANSEKINPSIIIYLNRLSDLLFVAARLANKRLGVSDVAWRKQ